MRWLLLHAQAELKKHKQEFQDEATLQLQTSITHLTQAAEFLNHQISSAQPGEESTATLSIEHINTIKEILLAAQSKLQQHEQEFQDEALLESDTTSRNTSFSVEAASGTPDTEQQQLNEIYRVLRILYPLIENLNTFFTQLTSMDLQNADTIAHLEQRTPSSIAHLQSNITTLSQALDDISPNNPSYMETKKYLKEIQLQIFKFQYELLKNQLHILQHDINNYTRGNANNMDFQQKLLFIEESQQKLKKISYQITTLSTYSQQEELPSLITALQSQFNETSTNLLPHLEQNILSQADTIKKQFTKLHQTLNAVEFKPLSNLNEHETTINTLQSELEHLKPLIAKYQQAKETANTAELSNRNRDEILNIIRDLQQNIESARNKLQIIKQLNEHVRKAQAIALQTSIDSNSKQQELEKLLLALTKMHTDNKASRPIIIPAIKKAQDIVQASLDQLQPPTQVRQKQGSVMSTLSTLGNLLKKGNQQQPQSRSIDAAASYQDLRRPQHSGIKQNNSSPQQDNNYTHGKKGNHPNR